MFYIGKVLLGYSEKEIWRMTIAKIVAIFKEYKKDHGYVEKKATIDDIIPF